ncbi:MAG: Ppx/GppA phosphatase family protein [Cyanobacteria bacterium P01_F01_bin.116]
MGNTQIHAVIDIGTNSILLLIANKTDGPNPQLVPILDQAKTVRLGENLLSTSRLTKPAMERTLAGLKTYIDTIHSFFPSPSQIFCFGTEALRRASNADEFCQRIKQELGLPLRILSPAEEAHYAFQGALSSVSAQHTHHLVIDIGGGSTEIVYGTANTVEHQQSFPIGAVFATEKFQLREKILPSNLVALKEHIITLFNSPPKISKDATVLLTGGTATTLAALDQQLQRYDIQGIDGYRMNRLQIESQYTRLNQLSLKNRAALPGMEAGRADVILPALVILLTLLEDLAIQAVQISVRGARYGLLL